VDDLAQGRVVRVDQAHLSACSWIAVLYSKLSIRTPDLRDFMTICATEAERRLLRPRD
jgi:hypothetical protein